MARLSEKRLMKIEGREAVMKVLKEHGPRVMRNVTRAAVDALAKEIRDKMKGRVAVDTGRLKKSIATRRLKPKFDVFASEVRVGVDTPYAWAVEFGSHGENAQPFIVPSIEEVRAVLPQRYRELVGQKLEKSLRRGKGERKK